MGGGNLHHHCGCVLLSGRLPHQCEHWFAMTGNSVVRNDWEFDAWESPPYNWLRFRITCHSEPVLKLVWESPSSLRPCTSKDGDCHASVRYFIAMTGNSMRGNLHRTAGRKSITLSFRASAHAGVGISIVIEAAFSYPGDCHTSVRYFIAMTGNSVVRNDREFVFAMIPFLYPAAGGPGCRTGFIA